jgi:hypothetical protein
MEEERRRSKRIEFISPVRYHLKGSQVYSDTIGKDISDSGLGFISNEFIPKSTELVFELNSPINHERSQALAQVVWISNQRYSDRFYVGARFLQHFTPV